MTTSGEDRGKATELRAAERIVAGTTIGHYRIEGVLGGGGMGVVYRAVDVRLNRPVAIKFLSADLLDAAARARFQREAQTASSLNHPHILTVHDVGELDGRQYLVTELVDGGTLADWSESVRGRRDWRRIVELLVGVGDGLAAAHDAGILHREVKPQNVLLSKSGHAKLADFGLAKSGSDRDGLTRHGGVGIAIGTAAYMSPEQATGGPLDTRSDVFSFGVVLYELLAAGSPFPGRTDFEIMQSILNTAPPPLSDDLPEVLRAIVDKALEKNPAERYQTMRDVVLDLKRVLRKSGDSQPSVTPAAAAGTRGRRGLFLGAGLVVVAALAVGAAAWLRAPSATQLTEPVANAPAKVRVAILPFDNLSPDPDNAFFADSLHQEILTTLAQVAPELEVVSRTTMMLYRTAPKPAPAVADEVGATHVLSASVRREGDAIRLSLELVDATDRIVLSESFDRTRLSALTLQSEVAAEVAQRLTSRVFVASRAPVAPTTDPEAYDFYLKARLARQVLNGAMPLERWLEVQRLLTEAIDRDPQFARAYVARSELHFQIARIGYDGSPARLALARQDVDAAERLAPGDPATLAARALLAPTATETIERLEAAERAGLTDPDLLFLKAGALTNVGRAREAVELLSRLSALDPGNAQLTNVLWLSLTGLREPQRVLETLDEIEARIGPSSQFEVGRALTTFMFTGDAEVFEALSGAEFFGEQVASQDPGNALRDNIERLVWQQRFVEARDLIDSDAVRFEVTRNVFVANFRVADTGDTPNAHYRGFLSLLLRDSAAAAQDGRRVLDFLADTMETPSNRWYRLSLRADASLFQGDGSSAVAYTRDMLDITEDARDNLVMRNAARVLAARTLAWTGESDVAVDLLEKLAVDEPGMPPALIARQPWYTVPLADHPRFRALVARLEAQMAATVLRPAR